MTRSIKLIRPGTAAALLILVAIATRELAHASTYVAFIPLDDSCYQEFETLSDLGVLDTYIDEIKPISRIEAARLTLEAQKNSRSAEPDNLLIESIVRSLRWEFSDEVSWLEENRENGRPWTIHPFERMQAQYIYSSGTRRVWNIDKSRFGLHAEEGTPLLPYNDGIPTAAGSNEDVSLSGWAGAGSFLTVYGEGAAAGPFTRAIPDTNRFRLVSGAAVVNIGNWAVSVGEEQMSWGLGRFGALSQSNNAQPFPAIRSRNVHPALLPGFLKYLGQVRYEVCFGQLDGDRFFSHPWLSAQAISFKPLPFFEFGVNRATMFGGQHNNQYDWTGFLGRATGFDTGNEKDGNTNSRIGTYAKLTIPKLRRAQIYYEILGEDFFEPFGKSFTLKTPYKSPSYTMGIYVPEITSDGRTNAGAEYSLFDRNYSVHNDSLYWTYQNELMGDALGPGAWRVNASLGRWIDYKNELQGEFFFERRSDANNVPKTVGTNNESGFGGTIALLHLPSQLHSLNDSLSTVRASTSVEYVENINYSNSSSVRLMLSISFALSADSFSWSGH